MKPFLNLVSVTDVEKIIFAMPTLPGEMVSLKDAFGRRLLKPFFAPENLPGFARSTMDGFAVRANDVFGATETMPALLQNVGECQVGRMPGIKLGEGQCATIYTGAPLPEGADAVAMIEYSRQIDGNQIEITRSLAPSANIVEWDEDAHSGQQILSAGKKLSAPEIGMLAAFGAVSVELARCPRVAIISTGDEIVPVTEIPPRAQLRDVNSWSLSALCQANNAIPIRHGLVKDKPNELAAMLKKASGDTDVIVVSGGSSAGMRDYTIEAILNLPDSRILVHGVAIRPGKPFILAQSGDKYILGLPGHVSSALVCAYVFLVPLLNHLQGMREPEVKPWITVKLGRSMASAQGRQDYIPCKLEKSGNDYIAWPLLAPSAVLAGLLEADGYIICPENSEGFAKGHESRLFPFTDW